MSDLLEGFEDVVLSEKKCPSVLTLTANTARFNKATAAVMNYPKYVCLKIHPTAKKVAVVPCSGKMVGKYNFTKQPKEQNYSIITRDNALMEEIRVMLDFEAKEDEKVIYTVSGTYYPNENCIIFELATAKKEVVKRKNRVKKESK